MIPELVFTISGIPTNVYDGSKNVCDYPSTAEERYSPVLYESMIKKREGSDK